MGWSGGLGLKHRGDRKWSIRTFILASIWSITETSDSWNRTFVVAPSADPHCRVQTSANEPQTTSGCFSCRSVATIQPMLGIDRRTARITWTVVLIVLLLEVLYR